MINRLLVILCSSMVSLSLVAQVCDIASPDSCEICTQATESAIANYNTESRQSYWQSALLQGTCASEDSSLCETITIGLAENLKAAELKVAASEAERLGEVSAEKATLICLKIDCCSSEESPAIN